MNKKSVAILIPKLTGGGAERVASNLSIELSEYYNITLILFDGKKITYPYSGELIDLNTPPQKGLFKKVCNLIKRVIKIKKIKKERQITCSISLMDGPNIVNVLSKGEDKVITSVRIFMSASRRDKLYRNRLIMKLVSIGADKVVSLSHAVKNDLIKNFKVSKEKIIPIYNSCNVERLISLSSYKENKNQDRDRELSIVTMGRLTYQKGHWHLIRAFKKVVETMPNTKLYILGEGEKLNELKEITIALEMESNVRFLGYIENPHNFLSSCDVFVFPSLFEGLGNVLLESLACGMPSISSDCDAGPREILAPGSPIEKKATGIEKGEYGILVPVCDGIERKSNEPLTNNELLLAEAIKTVLEDEELRAYYQKKAVQRAQDFNSEKITNIWKLVIDSLTHREV